MRFSPNLAAALLALGTLALLGSGLTTPSPTAVEAPLMATAAGLSADGRDALGRAWPLFPQAPDGRFLQPLPAYGAALAVRASGRRPVGARWMSAAAGALSVALVYLIVQGALPGVAAAGAALLLAASPAHYAFSRLATEDILLVPFVLGWLLAMTRYLAAPRAPALAITGLVLGVGGLASETAPGVMALLLLCSVAAIVTSRRYSMGPALAGATAVLVPAVVLGAWYALHPSAYPDTMGRWAIHAAHLRNPWEGVLAFINPNTLGTRLSTFWGLWNPAFLFFGGPGHPAGLTGFSGPLLWPVAVWLVLGIRAWMDTPSRLLPLAAMAALAVTWPAATFGETHPLGRALAMVPLITIVAATSWERRLSMPQRAAHVVLAVAALAQFALFLGGYSPD